MNNELKVILDYLKDDKWDYYPSDGIPYKVFLMEERDKLLDYINNLQEENEFLKLNNPEMNIEHFRIVKENKRKIDNLRKENEDLKDRLKVMEHFKNSLLEENERLSVELNQNMIERNNYLSRCEKANEYLPEVRKTSSYELDEKIDNLESILNGGDEE